MLKTQSKTIGSATYKVTSLGASQGRALLVRLAKTLGPSAEMLLSGRASAWALAALLERLTDDDLTYACQVLGATTQLEAVPGRSVQLTLENQEIHFSGAYWEMFQWLSFALEVNFAGPLGSWANVLAAVRARIEEARKAEEESRSQKDSTGKSGE